MDGIVRNPVRSLGEERNIVDHELKRFPPSVAVAIQSPKPDAARSDDNVARHLEGLEERRVIYVKERLVNFVVG